MIISITSTATAETIEISDGKEFHDAIDSINKNGDTDNTIVLLNDIEITDNTFTKEDYEAALSRIVAIDYTGSGNLIIKSDSTDSRRFYTNFSNTSCYPFFNISGNDTTVTFENVIFDGYGIVLGKKLGYNDHSYNAVLKNARVYNCSFSGIQLYNTNNSELNNVTVSGCSNTAGGGLCIRYCENLTINDCLIVNNTAADPKGDYQLDGVTGGGIYLSYSSVDIGGDTEISGNLVHDSGKGGRPKGGGIDSDNSTVRISDYTNISNNSVLGIGLATGGGIFMNLTQYSYSHPTGLEITGNAIISNNKAFQGGGIFVNHASDTATVGIFNISGDVQISENTAEKTSASTSTNDSRGGGIYTFADINISDNVKIQKNKAVDNSSSPELTVGGGIVSGGNTPYGAVNLSDNVQITDNEAGYGGGICFYKPLTIKNKVLIADNKAYSGGGLYGMSSLILQDNATVSQNDAEFSGGGLLISKSTAQISGNVEISNNTAGSDPTAGGVGGGGIFVNNSTVTISDNTLISNNTAQNGGGLFARYNSTVYLSNNTTFERNHANNSGGFGGAVFMFSGSKAETSGNAGQTVLFLQNGAYADGGAVYVYEMTEGPENYTFFKKTTDDSTLSFSGNVAQKGYLWNFSDSDLTSDMEYIKDHIPELKNTTASDPFSNVYNNFDIVFADGDEVTPASVTVHYFADSKDDPLLGSESFVSYTGAEITENKITSELGEKWADFYRPSGYKAGQLQESLPLVLEGNTSLTVIYLENDGNNSTGGGSGTGNATVTDPNDNTSKPGDGQGPGPGEPEEPDVPIFVILLFMIAVACYVYVMREENEEDKLYMV